MYLYCFKAGIFFLYFPSRFGFHWKFESNSQFYSIHLLNYVRRMLSKWIYFLLKFFDICGFHTEVEYLKNGSKGSCKIFLLHICWAFATIIIVITFTVRTSASAGVLPYMVNVTSQNICGVIAYWVIIIESFAQRKNQAKFWHFYQCIRTSQLRHLSDRKPPFNVYLVKFTSFFTALTPIGLYLMYYFLHFVENVFFFRFTYFFLFIVYQTRIFYYLFYLDLIKEFKSHQTPHKRRITRIKSNEGDL